ncbi:MAG: ribosome-associated translation inhibitor RaiA [Acutalibacteraceae bacterium]|nr:ribosome-associated translation inhibitor RaiA [Acutalibacteraceae bacterium]
MKITYIARNVNLKDNFKERVEKKLSKFERIFTENASVNVTVTLQKNNQTVELTIRDNGMLYRAESTCEEMNDAVDRVVDIIGGLIRKNKTRLEKKHKSGADFDTFLADYEFTYEDTDDDDEEDTFEIARTKTIPVKPMSVEEAILQMNLLNHQFYMFQDADTDEISLVYKRKDGKYGLLVPGDETEN